MAVGDIYQGQVFYQIGSQETMNVIHLKEMVATTDQFPALTVARIIEKVWRSNYATDLFSEDARVHVIRAQRVQPAAGIPGTLVLGTAADPIIEGTGILDPVPSQAALLYTFYTAVSTRSGRGRIYIPGLDEGSQNDGRLTAAAIALTGLWSVDWEAQQAAIAPGTGEWRFCVLSRITLIGNTIVDAVARTNLATQRGRRNFPGVGA